jgi:hypothetical protein
MIRKASLLLIIVALATSANASRVIYQTGFETSDNAGWTVGASIASVDSWSVLAGDAKVASDNPQAGSQLVELAANTVIDRSITANDQVVWVQGWFRGTGSSGAPDFPASPLASAIIFFSSTGIQAFDGDGAGGAGNGFVATGASLSDTTWTKVSLRLDYSARTYNVYIDDAVTNSALGFRDNVSQLNGFQNLASEASFFDTFSVVARVAYDANGDGDVNIADGVSIVNEIETAGTISNPIFADNADGNLDGRIDETDRDDLVSSLLGL